MRIAFACLLLACLACTVHAFRPAPSSVPLNSDRYDASAAADGAVVVVTAPACATAYLSGGCMKSLVDAPEDIGAQRWSYAMSVVNGNATRCTFTLALPAGETVLPWFLVATSNCARG